MSRIDDLIRKLCPNGVDFKSLTELFNLRNGYTPSKSNPAYWNDNGTIPWFRMDDIRTNGGILNHALQKIPDTAVKGGNLFPANSLLVATSATIGEHALITVPHLSNQRFTSLALKPQYQHSIDMKYMYYYGFILDDWCRSNTTTSSFASVDMTRFKLFRIPVPPLPVQKEIVRILDSFTSLEAELEAELEARKKQYEYYRARLLGDSADTVMRLGDIFDMRAGTHISTVAISQVSNETQRYPCFGGNGIRGYVDRFTYDGDVVFIGRQGALCGNVHRMSGKFYATEHAVVVTPKIKVDMSWAFHKLTQMNLNQFKTKSAQPGLAVGRIKELTLRCPPFSEQHRIASMLDGFDDLVSNLSSGLPAEIAARRQQYEYYRDRLLTFKELTV